MQLPRHGLQVSRYIHSIYIINNIYTCHALNYRLWSLGQWGEDCSYQMWAPQCEVTL